MWRERLDASKGRQTLRVTASQSGERAHEMIANLPRSFRPKIQSPAKHDRVFATLEADNGGLMVARSAVLVRLTCTPVLCYVSRGLSTVAPF